MSAFPRQRQEPPGIEAQMRPRPDYGAKSYRGSGRLAGRKALITGGDSGIGRAVALAFAREGADVAINYLHEEGVDAAETVSAVEQAGRRCVATPGDIQDEAFCRRLVASTARELGGLAILVNNAACQMTHPSILEIPAAEIERVYRTNVFAMFYPVQAYQPGHNLLHYAVAPGPVWTPLIPSTMPEEVLEKFGQDAPLGRAAQPAEMAPIYVLLASNESSYVTGMVYGATGGEVTA